MLALSHSTYVLIAKPVVLPMSRDKSSADGSKVSFATYGQAASLLKIKPPSHRNMAQRVEVWQDDLPQHAIHPHDWLAYISKPRPVEHDARCYHVCEAKGSRCGVSQRAEKEETVVEYEALNFDGLERRANYRVIAYREDMLHIFERRDAAAIIYHIIYRWQTEYRRSEVLKEIERRKKANLPQLTAEEVEHMMWVYMSYNTFVRESGHALGYNTIIRALDYLINDIKALEQRPNHDPHYPDYEYRISKAVVRPLLKELPAEPAFTPKIPKKKERSTQTGTEENGSTQTGIPGNESTQTGTDSTQTGIATTQTGTEVYPNGGISQIPTGNTQVSSQEEEGTYGANAPTHADISHQREIVEKRITHPRIEAVSAEMLSDSHAAIGNEDEQRLNTPGRLTLPSKPAVKLQAVAAGQTPIVTSLPIDDDPSRQSTVSQTPGTVQASRSLLPSEPAQADFPPAGSAASGTTTAQASGRR